jgi:hypothetical protein
VAALVCCATAGERGVVRAQRGAQGADTSQARQEPSVIVIVRSARDARVVKRVRAELEAWPVRVIELGPARGREDAALAALAEEQGAQAALRVNAHERRVELWVARPVGSAHGTLETITVEPNAARADEILAVRVTEALRAWDIGSASSDTIEPARAPAAATAIGEPTAASGEPAASASAPEANEVARQGASGDDEHDARDGEPVAADQARRSADADVDADTEESRGESDHAQVERAKSPPPSVWLGLGPAITFGAAALEPELHVSLSARVPVHDSYSVSVVALLPVVGGELDAPEGRARLTTWLLGAGADVQLELAPVTLGAGAGVAALLARALAEAPAAGLDGVDDSALAAAPFVRGWAQLELGARFGLRASGYLGVGLPAVAVRLLDRDRARWGRPFVSASLSLDAAF